MLSEETTVDENITINQDELRDRIEFLVHQDGLNYVEALFEVADEYDIDPIDATALIVGPLKAKIQRCAIGLNYVKDDGMKNVNQLF